MMILSLLSLFCSGCNNAPPRHKLILIDISGSNVANINKTIDKVNGVYMDSMPNDTFSVYFFSSVKYLAFEGGRLAKDRDFLPQIKTGYGVAKNIRVISGTSFDICKKQIESASPKTDVFLYTDGYFENSKLSSINLANDEQVQIVGLNIANNETVLNCFKDKTKVKIDFQGK